MTRAGPTCTFCHSVASWPRALWPYNNSLSLISFSHLVGREGSTDFTYCLLLPLCGQWQGKTHGQDEPSPYGQPSSAAQPPSEPARSPSPNTAGRHPFHIWPLTDVGFCRVATCIYALWPAASWTTKLCCPSHATQASCMPQPGVVDLGSLECCLQPASCTQM